MNQGCQIWQRDNFVPGQVELHDRGGKVVDVEGFYIVEFIVQDGQISHETEDSNTDCRF